MQVTVSQISAAFTRTQARIAARRMTREEHDAAQADLSLLEGVISSALPKGPQADQGPPAPRAKEPPKVSEK